MGRKGESNGFTEAVTVYVSVDQVRWLEQETKRRSQQRPKGTPKTTRSEVLRDLIDAGRRKEGV